MSARALNGTAPKPAPDPALAAEVARLEQWVRGAVPGERATYFVGYWLPKGNPAVAFARTLHARGEVLFTQGKREDGRTDYFITKRRNAEPQDAPARRGLARGPSGIADEEKEWLMAVLRRKASLGLACPTNRQLAEEAQLKDAESVRYRLGLLQQEGRIAVQWLAGDRRVVTIVASGRSTAR